jgi:hypothetical protein
MIRQHSKKH